ncbi:hypothetical protein [Infirmifilum sp. SLHALR2]|nr:MAG: hypothetical protein B7L53_05835 [Thermofilum sp. NZ13]
MLKSVEEALLTIFEVLLLASVLVFAQDASVDSDVLHVQGLLPPGACTTVYSSKPITLNGTQRGNIITVCRNHSSIVVVEP